MTRVVRIRSVRSRKQKWSTLFEVLVIPTDGTSDTRTFRTRNQWRAAMCERAKQTGQAVQFTHLETWWGTEIQHVEFVEQEQEQTAS